MQTAAFKSFAGNKKYLENISDIVFGSDCYNQLIVTEENFRVDLPQSFKSEKKAIFIVMASGEWVFYKLCESFKGACGLDTSL